MPCIFPTLTPSHLRGLLALGSVCFPSFFTNCVRTCFPVAVVFYCLLAACRRMPCVAALITITLLNDAG